MLAGNPFKRAYTDDFAGQAVSFVCLDYSGQQSGYYNALPPHACPDGIRAQVFFPSCWDGVNLDMPDHASHMAYPTEYSYDNGPCPASHPVHMISVFFEVIYSSIDFPWWVPEDGTQPFVFAMGDPTGYGFHGDFLNGWDVPTLQAATNLCTNESGSISDCPVFDFFDDSTINACLVAPSVRDANGSIEVTTGILDALPGCNPVQWDNASPVACNETHTIGEPMSFASDYNGWTYVGCGEDNATNRTFSASQWWSNSVSVDTCMDYCKAQGYNYIGLEYATQC